MIMKTVLASSPPDYLITTFTSSRCRFPPPLSLARHCGCVGSDAFLVAGLGFRSSFASIVVSNIRALQGEDEVEVVSSMSMSDLEEELYDFMASSARPGSFPTREELIAAGRADLAVAVAERGGWLALGWDLEEEEDVDTRVFYGDVCDDVRALSSSDASSSGRPFKLDWDEEDAGIHGILCRLKKQRSVSFGLDDGDRVPSDGDNCHLRRPDIIPNSKRDTGKQCLLKDSNVRYKLHSGILSEDGNGRTDLHFVSERRSQLEIHIHLQHMQSKLNSTLGLLRSINAVKPSKSQGRATKQLDELSDALEFKETEIVKAQHKLKAVQAESAVVEGKASFEIVEAEKSLEEKKKKINSMETALQMLCTVLIVWPSSASEVILTGSFDGWTSQRRMERSSTGLFSLYLMLYPGRYEIKFIVDGVWRVDPLRPVVNNNGYENNVLVIT